MSPSRRAALASLASVLIAASAPTPRRSGVPAPLACTTPNSIGCVAKRAVQAPHVQREELRGTRYVPPAIDAFLNNPKVAPETRAFLRHMAAKQTMDWTIAEYQITTELVPVLVETAVPTRVLSDFYQFLGLDPTSLFEARLGQNLTSNGFDAKSIEATDQAQCFYRLGYGENLDPTVVTLKDIAACTGG